MVETRVGAAYRKVRQQCRRYGVETQQDVECDIWINQAAEQSIQNTRKEKEIRMRA